jgi:hypothetical protein
MGCFPDQFFGDIAITPWQSMPMARQTPDCASVSTKVWRFGWFRAPEEEKYQSTRGDNQNGGSRH